MTPFEVAAYLDVMKKAGVMAGSLEIQGVKLSVQFEPPLPSPVDAKVHNGPGGWKKAPEGLDASFLDGDV